MNHFSMKKLSILLLLGLQLSTFATSYLVTNSNSSGAGSLKEAIKSANADVAAPHTISFSVAGSITLDTTLVIKKSMTISGTGRNIVTISGADKYRILHLLADIEVNLVYLTLVEGKTSNGGAAISNMSTLSINNCTFTNNTIENGTGQGAAIWSNHSLTVSNSTFDYNVSKQNFGGAVALYGPATFTNCTFAANTATSGGAICNFIGSSTYINCTFTGNTPEAIRANDGTQNDLVNCILAGNQAEVIGKIDATHCIFGVNADTNVVNGLNNKMNVTAAAVFGANFLYDYGGPTRTIAILASGPAADAGASGRGIPSTDQRGYKRDALHDIGAYEYIEPVAVSDDLLHLSVSVKYHGNTGLFAIEQQEAAALEWKVLDLQGQTLIQGKTLQQTFIIDLGAQNPGMYLLVFSGQQGLNSTKVVIP